MGYKPDNRIKIVMEDGYYAPSTVLWLLAEHLSVRQSALLMLNVDPEIYPNAELPNAPNERPIGYLAARQVIASALLSHKVSGNIEWETQIVHTGRLGDKEPFEEPIEGQLDVNRSYVNMDSLREWLASKNVTVEQFMGLSGTSEDFLERDEETYSPKLAATVAAWRHVSKNQVSGVSVKQQLMNWMRENSEKYWPSDTEAKVSDTFIKEAARIANWESEGGRPSTSNEKNRKSSTDSSGAKHKLAKPATQTERVDFSTDFDDEIPF